MQQTFRKGLQKLNATTRKRVDTNFSFWLALSCRAKTLTESKQTLSNSWNSFQIMILWPSNMCHLIMWKRSKFLRPIVKKAFKIFQCNILQSDEPPWSGLQSRFPFVMGTGQNFLPGSGWVSLGQPSMIWAWFWKISLNNVKIFNFYPLGQKNIFELGQKVPGSKAGRPLIYCGSGRVRAHH